MYINSSFLGQVTNKDYSDDTTKENNKFYDLQNNKNYDLYDLISNLDKPLKEAINHRNNISKTKAKNADIPFEFRFLEEMTNDKFIELFTEGISFIKINWTLNDLSILKRLFFELETSNKKNPKKLFFGFLYEQEENKLNNVYKKDFILSLFLQAPTLDNKSQITNINEEYNIYFKNKIKEISLYFNFNSQNAVEFNEDMHLKLDEKDIIH